MLAGCSDDIGICIAQELSCALRLLGADSSLQSAVNSIWERDFDMALEFLRNWNNDERDRIAAVLIGYSRWGVWAPDTQYRRSAHQGCSHRVSLTVQTADPSE